jgi:ferredoxin--NADP+ reductase
MSGFQIVEKKLLSPNTKLFKIKAPLVAKKAQPGQFIMLKIDEKGERIPLTIADFDRDKGTISIVFQEIGKTTNDLGALDEGNSIMDFTGPLGTASDIAKVDTIVFVGGGTGIACVYPIARAFKENGAKVISIIGARNKDLLFWEEKIRSVSDEIVIATDDGSRGRKGVVTEPLKELVEKEKIDEVFAIGPPIMMKFVALTTKPYNVKTIVSLNPIMVDATGMCGACRVEVGGETKFACVDGPEFDAHKVNFDLLLSRLAMYKDKEAVSMKRCKHAERD